MNVIIDTKAKVSQQKVVTEKEEPPKQVDYYKFILAITIQKTNPIRVVSHLKKSISETIAKKRALKY